MTRPEGPSSAGPSGASRLAVWVAAVYAVVSALWIAFSDAFVASVAPSVQDVTWWSTLKGFGFVAVTALLLHAGLRWAIGRERRAEEALRSAVRRYELLAEHARDIILFVRRADGRILDANAAAAATYGWSRDELRAMTIYDLRVPGPAAEAAALMSATDAGGIRFNAEHRRKDGTSIPVEVNSQGTLLDGERVIVSVVRDATERREREEALRESEERLALAIEAAGIGTFHALPYGRMEWSPRCREIFGVGDASLPDFEAFLVLVHPDDREAVRGAVVPWLDPSGDGNYQQQYRVVRSDGTVRWVSAHGKARFAEVDGVRRPVRLAGTILDVTDVKQVQAQLMQSDRLASVGMLAAGVAHEINNPLAYLSAALDFLHEHAAELSGPPALRREALRALGEAREGADRVRRVVRELRTFSGTREDQRSRVELEPVLESAIHIAANELRYRARVVRDYGPAPAVVADEARLGQVVLNLLINAAQAIPEGRTDDHEIRVVTSTDARGRAVVEVRDTGAGIPPRSPTGSSIPSSRRSRTGSGPGWGSPSAAGSSSRSAARSACRAAQGPARRCASPSPLRRPGPRRASPLRLPRPPAGGAACSWWTTSRRSPPRSGGCSRPTTRSWCTDRRRRRWTRSRAASASTRSCAT